MTKKRRLYKPDPSSGYTDVRGAAEFLGLSVSTLYKLTADDKIPCYRPSRRVIFKISDLQLWVEETINFKTPI
jgi:excisionase family DNA binding protein